MKKQKKHIDVWDKCLKWTLKSELNTYRYLCEDMGFFEKRNHQRKKDVLYFNRYVEWSKHVKENISVLDCGQKEELFRYLKHQERVASINDKMSATYLIPITVAMIAPYIPKFIEGVREVPLQNGYNLLLIVGSFLLVVVAIYKITELLYCEVRKTEIRRAFYKDYIEILCEDIEINTKIS